MFLPATALWNRYSGLVPICKSARLIRTTHRASFCVRAFARERCRVIARSAKIG
jgi:hypothetical protein